MDAAASRFFTDRYDYNNLLERMEWDDADAARAYLGLLRLDSILFRKLVLTDAQLLHSRFFLNATTIDGGRDFNLFEALPFERIEVRCRAQTLENSFVAFLKGNSPKLKGHLFPAIRNADALQAALSERSADEVRTWDQIPSVLRSCGAEPEDVERLKESWSKILKSGKLQIVPWSPIDWNNCLATQLNDHEWLEAGLETHYGRTVLKRILSIGKDRASVVAELARELATPNLGRAAKTDLQAIGTFHANCYNKVLAQQHGCRFKELSDVHFSRSLTEEVNRSPVGTFLRDVQIPISFLECVGKMDSQNFENFVANYRTDLGLWYDDPGQIDTLRFVADKLVTEIERVYSVDTPSAALKRIVPALKFLTDANVTGPILAGGVMGYITHDVYAATAAGATALLAQKLAGEALDPKRNVTVAIVERGKELTTPEGPEAQ